jgi:ABC-type glutathione transport system ATPase component
MSPEPPILSVKSLSVALPAGADRPFAIQDISLDLRPAEILCIVGESGSGKSILSSTLMGALPRGLSIHKGDLTLGEIDLTALSERAWRDIRGRRIAMIPQEPMAALNPSAKVGRQIEEVFAIHGELTPQARRAEAIRLIQEMHLPDPERIAASYPHQLSGGQCQRICIAMALGRHQPSPGAEADLRAARRPPPSRGLHHPRPRRGRRHRRPHRRDGEGSPGRDRDRRADPETPRPSLYAGPDRRGAEL